MIYSCHESNSYNPSICNASVNSCVYRQNSDNIWNLGSWNEEKQINDNRHWNIVEFNNNSYRNYIIPIPDEINTQTINHLQYDNENDWIYMGTGVQIQGFSNDFAMDTNFVLYTYSVDKNEWNIVFTTPFTFKTEDMLFDYKNHRMIIFGFKKSIKTFIIYDLKNNSFQELDFPSINDANRGFTIIYDDEKYLYVYGGFDNNDRCYNELYRLDSFTMKVVSAIDVKIMSGRTFAFGCYIKSKNALLFYGGTEDGYEFTNTGFIYSIDYNQWSSLPQLSALKLKYLTKCCYNKRDEEIFLLSSYRFFPDERKYLYCNNNIARVKL